MSRYLEISPENKKAYFERRAKIKSKAARSTKKISQEHEAAHFNELHGEGYSEQDQINDDYDQSEQDSLDREGE